MTILRRGQMSRGRPEDDLSFAADAAHDLLDRRVALEHGEQPAVEDRAHAVTDRSLLDCGIAGPLEDQTIDRSRRHQQLGDRPSPAKARAAARGTAHRVIQRDRFCRRQSRHVEPLN